MKSLFVVFTDFLLNVLVAMVLMTGYGQTYRPESQPASSTAPVKKCQILVTSRGVVVDGQMIPAANLKSELESIERGSQISLAFEFNLEGGKVKAHHAQIQEFLPWAQLPRLEDIAFFSNEQVAAAFAADGGSDDGS